jgi:branched-chain amino acid transport system substrate-binding protein
MLIKNVLKLLFVSSFLLILLISCARKSNDITAQCRIGAVLDLTGSLAIYGTWVKEGLEVGISDYNKLYPKDKLELITEDSISDVKPGVSAFQKLVNIDRIKFVVMAPNSSTVMAAAPIANENKTLLFTPAASSPSITDAGKFIMRNRVGGNQEVNAVAKYAISELKTSEVGIAILNNDAGFFYKKAFIDTFSKFGGKVPADVTHELGETDFRSQAAKLKSSKLSTVFIGSSVKEAAYLIKNSYEIGFKHQWITISPVANNTLLEIAGQSAEGLIVAMEGITEKTSGFGMFNEKIKATYGHDANFLNIKILMTLFLL